MFGSAASSSAQPVQATGFNIINAQWGTAASPFEAGAGEQNVPLTVTLQYFFYNTANTVEATLSLPSGFTDTNGLSSITTYLSGSIPSGTVFPLTSTSTSRPAWGSARTRSS